MDPSFSFRFPFQRILSLHKLVDAWRQAAASSTSDDQSRVIIELADTAAAIPELMDGVTSVQDVAPYRELIKRLMVALVPLARSSDWLVGGMPPFTMEYFYGTSGFLRLLEAEREAVNCGRIGGFGSLEELERAKTMNAFHIILQEFYGVESTYNFPSIFSAVDDTGVCTYYRLHIDPAFVEVVLTGPKPELTEDQIRGLIAEPFNIELWTSMLPPDRFVFKGFTLVTLLDDTEHEVHSRLKNDLLQKDALTTPEKVNSIEQNLRSLLRIPDLRLGVLGLTTGRFEDIERSKTFGRSLLMTADGIPNCPNRADSSYAKLFATGKPVVISDLDHGCDFCTGFEGRIREQNFRGLLLAPLKDGDRLTGVIELATTVPDKLTALSVAQLMDVLTLFSAAMVRSMDERQDRIQALIKKEFTSIHPAVEWKFREAAEKIDHQSAAGSKPEPEDIVFEGVYPLYGLSDIRDSSVQRSRAIQEDLIEQLGLALAVIVEAGSHQPLPALDELGFRTSHYAQLLGGGLTSDAEVGALEFLRNDVEPLFERLAAAHPGVAAKVSEYWDAIDPKLGVLYQRRRAYEESVAGVNETVSTFLQRQQSEAQSMYPHYFEKFETDGVDYNAYVGGNMVPDRPFDALYLRNLRLWQLLTMCGIVWELDKSQSDLAIPLDVAHLILVQDFPIAIRFSKDEKRFGVDGAYNARYMIVKKRVDKAHVNGSSERITQPGKIAIVYSQEKERREYLRFLDYLAAAGYIEGPVEELEVEPLQGVNGLRLLRVRVSANPPQMELRTRPDLAAISGPQTRSVAGESRDSDVEV